MKRAAKLIIFVSLTIIIAVSGSLLYKHYYPPELPEPVWTRNNSMVPVTVSDIKDSNTDSSDINDAINQNLRYLNRLTPDKKLTWGPDSYTVQEMKESAEYFRKLIKEKGFGDELYSELKNKYRFYSSSKEVLFTGYYESRLNGSIQKSEKYRYPLYALPDDIVNIDLSKFPGIYRYIRKGKRPPVLKARISDNSVHPYYNRKAIDIDRVLADRSLELLWVDDRIELFFLQIQGSGIVSLDDGSEIRVNYAGTNGHPYKPIGRYLLQNKLMKREEISMQSIRKYLEENPDTVDEILNYNPSVVFFRTVDEGPIGAAGVPLTPMRSIATDSSLFPRGALCLFETEIPVFRDGKIERWVPYRTFVFNMDTGGAIKTPGRCDIFTGNDETSILIAGHMNRKGKLWFLIKTSGISDTSD